MIKFFLARAGAAALMLGGAMFLGMSSVAAVSLDLGAGTTAAPDLGIEYPAYSGLRNTDVRVTAAKIIRAAMGLLGIAAVVIILIGGFKWMTAGGNEEQGGEAKKWIYSGVIGLTIILSAYAIANFVVNSLVNATTAGDATTI